MQRQPLMAKILQWGIYVACFIPLVIFSQYLSPFHFGKVVVFRSIVELLLVFYIILVFYDKSYWPKFNYIVWSFLAFTLAFSITTIFSSQVYQSLWGTQERMGGLWTFWHFFVFFIILISIFRTKEDWMRLLKLVIGVGILSALYGYGQKTDIAFFIGGGGRAKIFGTLGNAALFAGYQILITFLSLFLFFRSGNSNREKVFFGAAVVICSIAIMMTAIRGSILALGIGFILFTFLYYWNYRIKYAKNILFGLIGLVILFGIFSYSFRNYDFVKYSSYLNRVTDFSLSSYTVNTRFWAWQAGFKGWIENPKTVLLGWGPENFNIPFSFHFNPKFFTGPGSETLFDRAHNMFVEVLVTMGLLGFLSYVSIFASIFYCLKKIKDNENKIYVIGLTTLTVAYMIHNSFIFDTSANFLTFFTILGFIYFVIQEKASNNKSINPKPLFSSVKFIPFAGFVIFIASLILIYKTNVVPSIANYAATRGIVYGWNNDFNGAVNKFKEAMSYDAPGKYEIRNRYAQYVLDYSSKTSFTPDIINAIKLAMAEVQKNADDYPLDYLPQLYLSRLNIVLGKNDPKSPYNDEALKHSMKALEISPTFVRTYYEIAQVYINKNDLPKAIEYFKKAAELNPTVGISYWYWGTVEIQNGNNKFGQELLDQAIDKGYDVSKNDLLKLVGLYLKENDYNRIVKAYLKIIKIDPKDAQVHASLAVAYARLGNITEAVKEAKIAAGLDPLFEPEAKRFVESLGQKW